MLHNAWADIILSTLIAFARWCFGYNVVYIFLISLVSKLVPGFAHDFALALAYLIFSHYLLVYSISQVRQCVHENRSIIAIASGVFPADPH